MTRPVFGKDRDPGVIADLFPGLDQPAEGDGDCCEALIAWLVGDVGFPFDVAFRDPPPVRPETIARALMGEPEFSGHTLKEALGAMEHELGRGYMARWRKGLTRRKA